MPQVQRVQPCGNRKTIPTSLLNVSVWSGPFLWVGVRVMYPHSVWPAGFRDSLSSEEAYRIDMGLWYGLERHFHVLPVKYWGRIDRTDRTGFSWRCQKEISGLDCKA